MKDGDPINRNHLSHARATMKNQSTTAQTQQSVSIPTATMLVTDTNVLADLMFKNRKTLFPCDSVGRSKGYYNANINEYCLLVAELITENIGKNIHTDILNKRFNSTRSFWNMNKRVGNAIECISDSYSVGRFSKSYKVSQWFLPKLDQILNNNHSNSAINTSLWHLYSYPTPHLTTYVKPSIPAMWARYKQLGTLDATVSIYRQRAYLLSLIKCYEHHGDIVPQYYDTSARGVSDRLWTQGALGIQSMPTEVRDVVLSDYKEYDLNAAAYTILLGLSEDKSKYPYISLYCKDTSGFRTLISQHTPCTVKEVKLAFLHRSFGSSLGYKTKIFSMLGSRLENLTSCEPFSKFVDEFDLLQDELLEQRKQEYETFKTKMLTKGEKSSKFKASFIASLYQSIELQMILVIREGLKDKDHCLLVHDAIYTTEDLDVGILSKKVKDQTGITITISKV
jgi:hypothetical protein